jgi:hypothetical protein
MIKTTPLSKNKELEDFKKNYKSKIEKIAVNKTEWLKDFKEVYQENRKPKQQPKTVKDYAKNKS